MNTGGYGGCTDMCKYGPWCGDGNTDTPDEECDNGKANGVSYVKDPAGAATACSFGCTKAHYCGDARIDGGDGEQCDDGEKNGTSRCGIDCLLKDVPK